MAQTRADGTPAREVNRRKLTDLFVSSRKGGERDELIWDLKQPGLALSVRPTGKKAWKVIYRFHGRPRWLHLGDVSVDWAGRCAAAGGEGDARRHRGQRPGGRAQGGAPDRHLRRAGEPVCRAARQEAQQVVAAGRGAGARVISCRAGAS